MDMHLYDPAGHHTGFDYESGMVETAIAGTTYSGLDAYPQVIEHKTPLEGLYGLRVVCREGPGDFTIFRSGIPPMPAILTLTSRQITLPVRRGGSLTAALGMAETGGTHDVQAIQVVFSDLINGNAVLSDTVYASDVPSMLTAGGGTTFDVNVAVPLGAKAGEYRGTLEASGESAEDGSPVAATLELIVSIPELGDIDIDGDIDLVDWAGFQRCFCDRVTAGPCPSPPREECAGFDFDGDGYIELADWAGLRPYFVRSE